MALPVRYQPPPGRCCDPDCRTCRPGVDRRGMLFTLGFIGLGIYGLGQRQPQGPSTHAQAAPPPAPPARTPVRVAPAQLRTVTATRLLHHPNLAVSDRARLDLQGRGDLHRRGGALHPELLELLAELLARHTLSVVVLATGHTRYVGGDPSREESLHYSGRAMDISVLDGQPVSSRHAGARRLVEALAARPDGRRPAEIGHPFDLAVNRLHGVFTDGNHKHHLHLGVQEGGT